MTGSYSPVKGAAPLGPIDLALWDTRPALNLLCTSCS